ncbi:MAG: hypothetical protein GY854_19970 [Deltaproteobacteria bacterium]|nr:hypothetical protein [Deltaproteobacteria bacterium]
MNNIVETLNGIFDGLNVLVAELTAARREAGVEKRRADIAEARYAAQNRVSEREENVREAVQ